MPHYTIEELEHITKVPPATLNRRLKFIKDHDTATYTAMLQKQGRVKTYDSEHILPKLNDWKAYVAGIESTPAPAAKALNPVVLPQKTKRQPAPPRRPSNALPPPPVDPERDKKLTELLSSPLIIIEPDADTKRIYDRITDPRLKERMEYCILICADYSRGEFTIDDCCTQHGVPARTFRDWTYWHPELAALYKRARQKARRAKAQVLGDAAQMGLLRLVQGEEWDEVTTIIREVFNPDGTTTSIPTGRKVTTKRQAPNTAAVIFALTNAMNRLYKNRFQHELGPTQEQVKRDEIDKMTPEERDAKVLEMFGDKFSEKLKEMGWTPPKQ